MTGTRENVLASWCNLALIASASYDGMANPWGHEMYRGTFSTTQILRKDIDAVNGFTSNGVDIFRANIDSALANWRYLNPNVTVSGSPVTSIRSTCADLANYLIKAGVLSKAAEVDRLKLAARSAVDEFQRHFADN